MAAGRSQQVVRLAVRALVCGRDIDLQVSRPGPNYLATVVELRGEVVVNEIAVEIDFGKIEEGQRLRVLGLWLRCIVLDAERWRRRHEVALRAVHADLRRRGLAGPALG